MPTYVVRTTSSAPICRYVNLTKTAQLSNCRKPEEDVKFVQIEYIRVGVTAAISERYGVCGCQIGCGKTISLWI